MRGLRRPCKHCNARFIPKRSDAEFCSNLCRQAAYFKRDRKRRGVQSAKLTFKRHQHGLAAIADFENYQSLAATLHLGAKRFGERVGFMGTKIGVLMVEDHPGKRSTDGLLPAWFRDVKTRSDDREIAAMLSLPSPFGSYIVREAEKECRELLRKGPRDVSLFVEDWDYYRAKYRPSSLVSFSVWPTDDGLPEDDGSGSSSEYVVVEGDGYQIIKP